MQKLFFLAFTVLYTFSAAAQSLPRPSLHLNNPQQFKQLANDTSLLANDFINGYPAVRIDSAGGWFSFVSDRLAGKERALFIVVYQPAVNLLSFPNLTDLAEQAELGLWSLRGDSVRNHFLTSVNVGDSRGKVKYNYFPETGPNVTSNLVQLTPHPNPPQREGSGTHLNDSTNIETTDSFSPLEELNGVDTFFIAKADTLLFRGKIAEFLVIDTAFTEKERQIWQSYLMLKYGVTMYRGNYLNSAGDTLWRYSDNQEFSAGTGGIGRDDTLGLSQRFSRIWGDSVTLAFSPLSSGRGVGGEVQNGEYILWGHNGEDLAMRVWKVKPYLQNSNYTLDIQLNVLATENSQSTKLFVAPDKNFIEWETTSYVPNVVENNKLTFTNITIPQTADSVFYFTFGNNATNALMNTNTDTGINTNQNPALQVFTEASYMPNPITDNLYINYKLTRAATIWFSVHNNIGLPVCQTSPQQKPTGDNHTTIPMSHLMQGTYTVYVHIDDMVVAQTVVKI